MPCYLRITGDFDPDKFIEDVELPLEVRHRKGDVGRRGAMREEPLLQISISDADFSDLDKQFEDMSRFVKRHKDALKGFCRLDAITSCTFDFGGNFDPVYPVTCRTIPRDAVIAAAICYASIEISLYSERKFDFEADTAIQSRAEQDVDPNA
jgi:hypothetical protein